MAIKFFFLPTVQSICQLVNKIKTTDNKRSEILNYAKKYYTAVLMLPVNPETLTVTTESDNKTVNVVNKGQIVIPKGVNLSKITIESFFPGQTSTSVDLLTSYVASYILNPISSVFGSFTPEQYFQYFENLQGGLIPVRLIITDCGVNDDFLVDSIEKQYVTCDKDLHYKLNLIQYKDYSPIKLKTNPKKSTPSVPSVSIPTTLPRPKTNVAVGDKVIVNGKYWYDSFGSKPFGTFTNFTGKISHKASNPSAKYKYHITTLSGGWRGWVTLDQIEGTK